MAIGSDSGQLDGDLDIEQLAKEVASFDIAILRVSGGEPQIAANLAAMDHVVAFTADHLLYWEWSAQERRRSAPGHGLTIVDTQDAESIGTLISASFANYRNHYIANPLLDRGRALLGYVEWAQTLMAEPACTTSMLLSASGSPMGFAIVDWSGDIGDIRLAAMHPDHQGGGLYRFIIMSVMDEVLRRKVPVLRISTQSVNTNVMRVWTRLGFVPFETWATYHLVRSSLLRR